MVGGLVLIAGIAVTYVLCIGHIRPPETAIESPATSIGEVYDCNMNSEFGDLIATPARAHFSPPCSPIVSVHPMVMRFPK